MWSNPVHVRVWRSLSIDNDSNVSPKMLFAPMRKLRAYILIFRESSDKFWEGENAVSGCLFGSAIWLRCYGTRVIDRNPHLLGFCWLDGLGLEGVEKQ